MVIMMSNTLFDAIIKLAFKKNIVWT